MEFLRIWEILLRRKWTIIILFVICFTTLVLWTHIVTPTYKATAKLLVETSDTLSSLMTNLGLQDMGGNIITTGESYSTDIALA
ncbi:MAG: Wzz/FepE/Etk N-terminal domain-containing protein, partial [Thermodesulfobacteriota bacterium]|nr:Wzz/FepE/Etk N-terminal domain-containing protein [Thermodesulfobacteriota bacterium]